MFCIESVLEMLRNRWVAAAWQRVVILFIVGSKMQF